MEFLHSFLRCHFAGKPVASPNVGCSLRLPKKGVLKVLDNGFFQTSVQGALSGSLSDKVVKFCVDNVCYKVTHDRGCSSSCSSFWYTSYNCNILVWPSCDSSCLNQYSGLGWSRSLSLKKKLKSVYSTSLVLYKTKTKLCNILNLSLYYLFFCFKQGQKNQQI